MHKPKRKAVELYERYEHLAERYAYQLYDYGNLGMTHEDVVQELKEKIWYSILKFAKKWAEYRRTNKYKPVPLPFYIQSNLKKVIIDLSKKINGYSTLVDGTNHKKVTGIMSMTDSGFDIGQVCSYDTTINFDKREIVLNGVNILTGLDNPHKKAYIMFLKGYPVQRIQNVFKTIDVPELISCQRSKLMERKSDLLVEDRGIFMSYSNREESNW